MKVGCNQMVTIPLAERLLGRLQASLERAERRGARIGLLLLEVPGQEGVGSNLIHLRLEEAVRAGDLVLNVGPGSELVLLGHLVELEGLSIVAHRLLALADRLAGRGGQPVPPAHGPAHAPAHAHAGGLLLDAPYGEARALLEEAASAAGRAATKEEERLELVDRARLARPVGDNGRSSRAGGPTGRR